MTSLVATRAEGGQVDPTLQVDPVLRRAVADALRSTGRHTAEYEVLRQVVSGSRMNYALAVRFADRDGAERVWCRGTYPSVDRALSERFTLAREHRVLVALAAHLDRIPVVLGRSSDGSVMIQRYVDEHASPDPADAIPAYMRALDELHSLDAGVLPDEDGERARSVYRSVEAEQAGWHDLAVELLARPADVAAAERASGLANLHGRVQRIVEHLASTPIPAFGGPAHLVHGDAGRANYLVDTGGAVWLIDWELAHAGHRYEDYAWIELRGLEQHSDLWCSAIVERLGRDGPSAPADYAYFRAAIYFRSVVAIAARIASEPAHAFVPYLSRRFEDNELFGWLSTGRALETAAPDRAPHATVDATRLASWHAWTRALTALASR